MDDGLFSGGERELTHQIKTAFNGLDLFIYQRDAEGAISLSNFKGTSKLLPFLWGELNLLDFHHCKDLGFSLETYNGKDHRRIIISISSRAHSVTTLQRQMSITWVKVRCFLDMMGSQELYSSLLLTCTTSSSSLSCSFPLHPSSFGAERWQVGEKTIKQILSVIQPTSDSEKRRREIIKYLQTLIEDSFGIKVFPFGSVPLKTYLPHGDVDLTAVSQYDKSQDLAADIHSLLRSEMMNNTKVQVKDVLYVPAQVKVVKCNVSDIAVDISFNQTAGLSALCFLEQVDQFIGKDHLFKRSVTLIKAWCYYESRLLGGYYGLISTYALETMVLHVINHFHCSLHFPLAVLYKFLEYYSMFDWGRYCVAINGLVSISSLPEIKGKYCYTP